MRNFTTAALFLMSASAFADNAKIKVNPFQGELSLTPSDAKVKSIIIKTRLQFCNFWGTTCAGGPKEEKIQNLEVVEDTASNLVQVALKNSVSVRALKPMNTFSSCNVSIHIDAVNAQGEKYEGYLSLVFENNQDVCESEKLISEQIKDQLNAPRAIKLWTK